MENVRIELNAFAKSTWKWMQSVRQKKGCWWYKSFTKIVLKFSAGISMRWAYSFVYLYVYWWQREIRTSLNHKGVSRFGNVRFDFLAWNAISGCLVCIITWKPVFWFHANHLPTNMHINVHILLSTYIHLVYIYIFLRLYISFKFQTFNRCLSIYFL